MERSAPIAGCAALVGAGGMALGNDSNAGSVLVLVAMILAVVALVAWIVPSSDPWATDERRPRRSSPPPSGATGARTWERSPERGR